MTKCNAEPLTASYAANNRFSDLVTYNYDAAGNMTKNGSASFTYDAENRVTQAGGVNYTYDATGRRATKSSGTAYWYDGGAVNLESDLAGNPQREYIYFGSERIARIDVGGAIHYYISDHLHSTSKVVSSAGALENDSDYFPFGGERQYLASVGDQHFKFTGKERDSESGLDFFGARYYSSIMGRWMSPDWSDDPSPIPYATMGSPQTLNLYAYVNNNPTTSIDVLGHGDQTPVSGPGPATAPNGNVTQVGCDPESISCRPIPLMVDDGAATGQNGTANAQKQTAKNAQNQTVIITYSKGVPKMEPKTRAFIEKIAKAAGIKSLNIGYTTNGKHALTSNHYNGTAVDINKINGKHVRDAGKDSSVADDVLAIQNAANEPNNGVAHENYGPAGVYKDGKQIDNKDRQKKLQSEHENHIHITIPRKSDEDD